MLLRWVALAVLFVPLFANAAQSEAIKDYHFSYYHDVQGSLEALEAFTKTERREAFLGVSCSIQSPLPLIQVILLNDEVISETPKLLELKLTIDGKAYDSTFNGILNVVDTTEEYSNKIRLEIPAVRGSSLQALQAGYQGLLDALQTGKSVVITLSHRTIEAQQYHFSLSGLKDGLSENISLCF